MSSAKSKQPATGGNDEAQERALIDRSTRMPVLFFFTSSAVWLVIAAALGLVSSIKLNVPDFMDWGAFLTYGRVYPAHMNALIYGWGIQAGIGAGLWIMARLCRVPLRNPVTLVVAGHFWNIGVTAGVLGILCGKSTSILWLEFPAFVWPILLISYAMITLWMIVMFRARRVGDVYISQWYLLAASFLFPWLYGTANLLIHVFPGSGVMAAAISSWFASGMIYLWFVPVGLGTTYYLIPKIVGRPVYSYNLAKAGFWALMIFGGWTGMQRFMGGPLPAWMPAMGSAATILILLPMLAVELNHHMTTKGNLGYIQYSPTLRFTVFGAWGFNLFILLSVALSFFSVGRYLQFTHAVTGLEMSALYGFFTMVMFGAFYFIAPRVTGCEWLTGGMIRFHFWFSAYGIITLVAFMIFGGMAQGTGIDRWDAAFEVSVARGWGYLVARSLGWGFILLSNLMFLFHTLLMSVRLGRRSSTEPTLISKLPDDAGAGISTGAAKA